jgi:hypothetical protein
MAKGWLDLMARDEIYREHIDFKSLKGQRFEIEAPVSLDLVLWLYSKDVIPVVRSK